MSPEAQELREPNRHQLQWIDVRGTADFLTEEEIRNLTIARGTLHQRGATDDHHHIVATIKMLERCRGQAPDQGAEYAGGHHERMDGKGLPSWTEAGADVGAGEGHGESPIFSRADRKDRPYKRGKNTFRVPEDPRKLQAENGHIDPNLFDVFVRRKIYLRYASDSSTPTRFDEVDEKQDTGIRSLIGRRPCAHSSTVA